MDTTLLKNILEYYKDTIKENFGIENSFIATNYFLEALQDEDIEDAIMKLVNDRIQEMHN